MKNFSLFFRFSFLALVFQTCYMVAEYPEAEKLGKEIGDTVEAMARQANQNFRYKQGPSGTPRYENGAVYSDYLHNKAKMRCKKKYINYVEEKLLRQFF